MSNCCYCTIAKWCPTFVTPWTAAHQAPPFSTISLSLLKLMSTESVMLSNCLIMCLSLLLLPSIFPSIRVFSSGSAFHDRCPKYWNFNLSISSSKEYSRLISFSIDWFDLLAVQGTLKSLLQHHNSKASILQNSAFFMAQLSRPYMTIVKNIAFTWIFIGKVMSVLFNTLSRFRHNFLSKEQAFLNFMAAVTVHSDFGAQEIKFVTVSIVSSSMCQML